MTNDLQIIKELQSRFGEFYHRWNGNKITYLRLTLEGVENKDLELIGELTSLEELKLDYNDISTIQGLEKLTNLKYLNLDNSKITTTQGLEKLTNLRWLHLAYTKIPKEEIKQFQANHPKITIKCT